MAFSDPKVCSMSTDATANQSDGGGAAAKRQILLITKNFSDNSTGRTYAIWSLAKKLGWRVAVIAPKGREMWRPLQGSPFESDCQLADPSTPVGASLLSEVAEHSDLIIAMKPFPETLGRAYEVGRATHTPVLLDIDDPDIQVRLPLRNPVKFVARMLLYPREMMVGLRMRQLARRVPVLVSNPSLQRYHGGTVIAHVRADSGAGRAHVSTQPSVVFVGTNRRHKGLAVVRKAVARLSPFGFSLVVTDEQPLDAKPWERWVGSTNIPEGLELVRNGDIVVIPSLAGHTTSTLQLPAKLIDAMIAGRALIVSDFAPLRWGAGPGAIVVRPGSVRDLTRALQRLADPDRRSSLGEAARARALDSFTLDAALPAFEKACDEAISAAEELTQGPE
jgi:glycosyltransferase involved in cell wall biosynthesis